MWGRGIYFAKNSSYSYSYSYKPNQSSVSVDRSTGNDDEREMFLTKLLCGSEVDLNPDGQLTCPPVNPKIGLRYNSVTGRTGGSQVWIVYENGRAYPDYLVRYYRGKRDPLRTPFGCRVEAQSQCNQEESQTGLSTTIADSSNDTEDDDNNDLELGAGAETVQAVWDYLEQPGHWKTYSDDHQRTIEKAYQNHASSVQIQTSAWTYEIDFATNLQTNVQHSSHTQRTVRRRISL